MAGGSAWRAGRSATPARSRIYAPRSDSPPNPARSAASRAAERARRVRRPGPTRFDQWSPHRSRRGVSCFPGILQRRDATEPRTFTTIMHIRDIFQTRRTTFSFEFFPPKTDKASDELFQTIAQLQSLRPSFVSVTYGAGGSTRERTHDLIVRIQRETQLTAVSHLTCVCHTREELTAILDRYAASNIENVLALRGDPPRSLPGYDRSKDAFQFADQIVAFVRSHPNVPDPRGFGIGVAGFPEGHPETPNRLKELDHFKAKVDAGADYIVTQLFFDNR